MNHEAEMISKIKEKDESIKLTQESYGARDMVVDDEIRDAILKKLKKKVRK